ncbi:uncharacterized protein LOC127711149 [Mytilus californianus]|uniref:uncharacterized protein LOC127711149 n=1 Tax=Mytilus californianus TaxID=6549 RepID=UPI002247D86F|nr:uncharacterized protein LOC127711149 [Mytilus californianus]
MAELQEYEEVRPVRRDEIYVYDDIKNYNKMDNVSSPSWKQYLKMFIMMISVSLMSAVVTYFMVNAQLQQKLNLYDKKIADIEKEKMDTENRNNITFSDLQKQIKDSTEQGKYESL